MFHPVLRYQGSRVALPALGDPRVFGKFVLALVGLALLVGVIAGAIDHNHALIAGPMLLGFGPVTAVDLREQALAKFLEAKALIDADSGEVKAENLEQFNALMTEAKAIDAQAGKAQTADDNVGTLRERLEYYTGKATGTPMRFQATSLDPNSHLSLGAQFTNSDAYKRLVASGALNSPDSRFRSDPVIIGAPKGFGAATSDVIHTESGGSAGPAALRIPGIKGYGAPPLQVRDLFPNETANSGDSVQYAAQTGFDKASGLAVKQSNAVNDATGVKKQSSVKWELQTAFFEWIATWIATTRQTLADVDQVRSFIDNQGRLMLAIEEEDQLINGNGTRPNISGILDQGSLQTLDLTGEDNLDGLRVARRLVKSGVSRLTADFVIVNPIDSEGVDLLKDDFGQYRGGNPIGNFTFDQPIWRMRRVESEAVAEGTAIVGSGAGATVYQRDPIQVLTADQHADFFVRNLVVLLFEERLGFPIYFPTAFVEVTLGDWPDAIGS